MGRVERPTVKEVWMKLKMEGYVKNKGGPIYEGGVYWKEGVLKVGEMDDEYIMKPTSIKKHDEIQRHPQCH